MKVKMGLWRMPWSRCRRYRQCLRHVADDDIKQRISLMLLGVVGVWQGVRKIVHICVSLCRQMFPLRSRWTTYAFLKSAADASLRAAPIFVAVSRPGGSGFSYLDQVKGRQDTHLIQQLENWMLEAGLAGRVTLRCNSEAAIQALAQMLVYRRAAAKVGSCLLYTSPSPRD